MIRLRMITAKELEKLLLPPGFQISRQKGSHVFYRHPDVRTTTVPHHKDRTIPRGLLRSILRDIRVDLEEFNNHFEK